MKKLPLYLLLFLLFASFTLSGTYNMKESRHPSDINIDYSEGALIDKQSSKNSFLDKINGPQETCEETNAKYFNLISVRKSNYHWKTSNSWFVCF